MYIANQRPLILLDFMTFALPHTSATTSRLPAPPPHVHQEKVAACDWRLILRLLRLRFVSWCTIKMLAIIPIRFRYLTDCIHCEILFEKRLIQKIWPKMWPPNFHLIFNFNILGQRKHSKK